MCVFVSWRGAFPHTWAICHILGKHSEWGGSAGGFGETGLRRPSSSCMPSTSSPCRVLLVAAHSWWPSATGRVWPHSPGKRGGPSAVLVWGHPSEMGGMRGGQCWGWGNGGGSALCTILGVTAVAQPFEPESPNIGALCCSFRAVTMFLRGSCPRRAESHLLLPRGKR